MKRLWLVLFLMIVIVPMAFSMEVTVNNATKLTNGATIPTDEGPLGTEAVWKLKDAPDTAWQPVGSASQPPPFQAESVISTEGYPAPEKSVIQVKVRNTLGTRDPGAYNEPADFTVPVNTSVGCSSPAIKSIK